jgi:peptidoglycan/LPS O-acetylase OafA/YrhL
MVAAVVMLGRDEAWVDKAADSAVASLLMVANFYFQLNSGGYFEAPASGMPLLHLWSLSVEEQFYLVYPALLALLLRWVPGGIVRRLLLLSLASLLLAEYWVHILPERAFHQMPSRFWELAVGAIVALSAAGTSRGGRLLRASLPVGLALTLAACVVTPAWGSFPGLGALPAVAGASLVLLGIHRGATAGIAAAWLRSRPMVGLGLVSYSLYLWHWPLLVFGDVARFDPAPPFVRWLLAGLAVVIAWLSWRWVEQPFRRHRLPSGQVLMGGIAAASLAVAATLALAGMDRVPAEARRVADEARADLPAILPDCHYDNGQPVEALKPPACWSRPGTEPTFVLWGDSHALAWQPFAWRLAESRGASAMALTMNSCLPDGSPEIAASGRQLDRSCAQMNELAMRWLMSRQVEAVVLGLRWPLVGRPDGPAPAALAARIRGIESVAARLPPGTRLLVIGPLPVLGRPAPTCIAMGWESDCAVPRRDHEVAAAMAWRELQALAARQPRIELIDPTGFFCDDHACPAARDGHGLYWDGNHVTATAAVRFAENYLADPMRFTRAAPATMRKPVAN